MMSTEYIVCIRTQALRCAALGMEFREYEESQYLHILFTQDYAIHIASRAPVPKESNAQLRL